MRKITKICMISICIYLITFLCFSPKAFAVDGATNSTGLNGHLYQPKNSEKSVCGTCHIPHGAKGDRIWAMDATGYGKKELSEIKDLCGSCHYEGSDGYAGIVSGRIKGDNGNVFLDEGADHIMGDKDMYPELLISHIEKYYLHGDQFSSSKTKFDTNHFPLHTDEDNAINEGQGFYCGSCHDPHKQGGDGGDYLRTDENTKDVGTTNDRKKFCRQCHPDKEWSYTNENGNDCQAVGIHTGFTTDPQCWDCHRVHDAYKYGDDYPLKDEKQPDIFKDPVPDSPWFQCPSGPETSEVNSKDPDTVYYASQMCIDCHTSPEDIWEDIPKLPRNRMHHPNGRRWADTECAAICHKYTNIEIETGTYEIGDAVIQLDGWKGENGPSLKNLYDKVFSCISCHTNHSEIGNDNFLRYADFSNDNSAFCEYCHGGCQTDVHKRKCESDLSANAGVHWVSQSEAALLSSVYFKRTVWDRENKRWNDNYGCGECMFCHFIHPNEKDMVYRYKDSREITQGATPPADLRAILRVPAEALEWDDKANENVLPPEHRYEAMCYGCHSDADIVGIAGKSFKYGENDEENSLLDTSKHSHRFSCKPDDEYNPYKNFNEYGLKGFRLGDMSCLYRNYGTIDDGIYCGTCHDVHSNVKPPYLWITAAEGSPYASPYMVVNEKLDSYKSIHEKKGFCEQCHCYGGSLDPNPDDVNVTFTHPVGDKTKQAVRNTYMTVENFPNVVGSQNAFFRGGSASPYGITWNGININPELPAEGAGPDGQVICLTCHNIHAATTNYDGEVKGSSLQDKDHGPLLVRDNFLPEGIEINSDEKIKSDGSGGDFCRACHFGG